MTKPNFEAGIFDGEENKDNLGKNWKNKPKFIPTEQLPDRNVAGLSPDQIVMMKEEGKIEVEPSAKEEEEKALQEALNDFAAVIKELDEEARLKKESKLDLKLENMVKVKEVNPDKAQEAPIRKNSIKKPQKFKGSPTIRGSEDLDIAA